MSETGCGQVPRMLRQTMGGHHRVEDSDRPLQLHPVTHPPKQKAPAVRGLDGLP